MVAVEIFSEKEKQRITIRQFDGISELTPEVMKALVKRVVVYPDKHIYIEWNFLDNIITRMRLTNYTSVQHNP